MKKLALALLALSISSAALADSGIRRTPCGYQQITSLSSAQALTVPTTCGGVVTTAFVIPETQAVRYRDDGTDPTASVGQPLAVGVLLEYTGSLSKIKFIEQTASAKINILYYK